MKRKLRIKTRILTVITLLLLVISLFPFYYMVVQSFTQWDMVDKVLIPQGFTLRSYEYLISKGGASNSMMWVRALINSFIVSFPTALISVAVGLGIGYSVTKLRFGGKKFIMNTLLFQMFFPAIILLVPRYMIAKPMANKYVGMIIPLSISVWGELMWDMLISPSIEMQTLNVLISTQFKPMGAFPGPMYAASVILTLPIIVLFLCFSKYFKEGISFMLK